MGEFAPKFAQLNDDVLFGEVWSWEEQLSLRDRSLVTVVALVDSSFFQYHLLSAKKNGITKAAPRDAVNIPAGVKHCHGAAADSWFSHLAVEVPGENCSNEWLEPVSDEDYAKLL